MKRHTPIAIALSGLALLLALAAFPAQAETAKTDGAEATASDAYLVAKGEVTYRVYCASCHGVAGAGDGPLAEMLTVAPADLTQLSANNDGVFPRERVHATIDGRKAIKGHGTRDMPIWGLAFQKTLRATWKDVTDEERAQLKIVETVYYLDSIQE